MWRTGEHLFVVELALPSSRRFFITGESFSQAVQVPRRAGEALVICDMPS
ncbi:MAG: hypothetical protein AAB408_04940 [Patescibacteria group bacterium]